MSIATGLSNSDLPNSPHARQLRSGFPWLTFESSLEADFRSANFDENLLHTRVNLCLATLIVIAFSAMDALVLGPQLNRIPSRIYILVIIPMLLIGLASSFSARRHRLHAPLTIITMTVFGLSVAAIQIIASLGGNSILIPSLILSIVFIYFMSGLIFYHAVAANVVVMLVYLAAGTALVLRAANSATAPYAWSPPTCFAHQLPTCTKRPAACDFWKRACCAKWSRGTG